LTSAEIRKQAKKRRGRDRKSPSTDLTTSSSVSSTDLTSSSPTDRTSDLTHRELGANFREIGRWIAGLPAEDDSEPTNLNEQQQKEFEIFKQWIETPPTRFGQKYRNLQPRQDEAVSTASVRELINGISAGLRDLPASERPINAIARSLAAVSTVRMATKFTGVAEQYYRMQHPTGPEGGTYGKPTGREHYHSDLDRRRFVESEARVAAQQPDATIESVFREMISAGGGYTVNAMAAPAASVSVEPYLPGNPSQTDLLEQTEGREELKNIIEDVIKLLGGEVRRRSSQRVDAEWERGRRKSLSPRRGRSRSRSRDRSDFSPKPRQKAKPRRRSAQSDFSPEPAPKAKQGRQRSLLDSSPEPQLRSSFGTPETDLLESTHGMTTRSRARMAPALDPVP
jgi:hypothetical protein